MTNKLLLTTLLISSFLNAKAQKTNPNELNFLLESQNATPILPHHITKKEQKALNTEQNYELQFFPQKFVIQLPDIKPVQLPIENKTKNYTTYLTFSYGNYSSLVGELFVSKKTKNTLFGSKINYLTIGKGDVALQTNTELQGRIFGDVFLENWTIRNALNMSLQGFYFYGNTNESLTEKALKQKFEKIVLQNDFQETNTLTDWQLEGKNELYFWKDLKNHQENILKNRTSFSYQFSKKEKIGIGNESFIDFRKKSFIQQNSLFYGYQTSNYSIETSAGLAFDKLNYLGNAFKFLPKIVLKYSLIPEKMQVRLQVSNAYQYATYEQFTQTNNFLEVDSLQHSFKPLIVQTGINYNFNGIAFFEASYHYEKIQNKAFFVNRADNFGFFELLYDDVLLHQFFFKSSLKHQNLYLSAQFTQKFFQLNRLEAPYHEALQSYEINADYKLKKWAFRLHFLYLSTIYYRHKSSNLLPNPLNLDFYTDFRVHKNVLLYSEAKNIFSQNYSYYYAYPNREAQFLGGLKVLF